MPNREGLLYIVLAWVPVIAAAVLIASYCSGCYSRYTVRGDSTTGIPSVNYEATPFTSITEVDVSPSVAAEERCLAHRRTQRAEGGSWIWSDDQMTCFWQASMGSMGIRGGIGVSGGLGYAVPRLGAPGVR
ncbi:hypothetical protein IT407_04385 [Candidatus Uhrbacteria bacterium]|nr:hypothetical protein [Candidatus Uhrbacteria bacterium]